MEQPINESDVELEDGSETSPANPEKSRSLSMPELLELMRSHGWAINPGEFSAILPGLGPQKPKPEEDEQDKQEE